MYQLIRSVAVAAVLFSLSARAEHVLHQAPGRFDSGAPNASTWNTIYVEIDDDGLVNLRTDGWIENREKAASVSANFSVTVFFTDGTSATLNGASDVRTGFGLSCGGLFGSSKSDGTPCAVGTGSGGPPAKHKVAPGARVRNVVWQYRIQYR